MKPHRFKYRKAGSNQPLRNNIVITAPTKEEAKKSFEADFPGNEYECE